MQSVPLSSCNASPAYMQSGGYDNLRTLVSDAAQALQQNLREQRNTLSHVTSITENIYQILENTRAGYNNALKERNKYYHKLKLNNEKLQQVSHVIRRYAQVKDPVTASDGYTYEREQIEVYLHDCKAKNSKAYSQQTKEELTDVIIPNLSLINVLSSLSNVHETELPLLPPRPPIVACAATTCPTVASSSDTMGVSSSHAHGETNGNEMWRKVSKVGMDGPPGNIMRGVEGRGAACELEGSSATCASASSALQISRYSNSTNEHVVVGNTNSTNIHRLQNKSVHSKNFSGIFSNSYANSNNNNNNCNNDHNTPTSACAVPRPALLAKQQSAEQCTTTPEITGDGVRNITSDASGVVGGRNSNSDNNEDASSHFASQAKSRSTSHRSGNRRLGESGSYKHGNKSSAQISANVAAAMAANGGVPLTRHPCLRVYGHCNFMNDCTFTKYPFEACLNNIKGKCRFGSNCKELHIDPRNPEYQNPRRSAGGNHRGNNSNTNNNNNNNNITSNNHSNSNENKPLVSDNNAENGNKKEGDKTQAESTSQATHTQPAHTDSDTANISDEVATNAEVTDVLRESYSSLEGPKDSSCSSILNKGAGNSDLAEGDEAPSCVEVSAKEQDTAAPAQACAHESKDDPKNGVEPINWQENIHWTNADDVSREKTRSEEVVPSLNIDASTSTSEQAAVPVGEAIEEVEGVLHA